MDEGYGKEFDHPFKLLTNATTDKEITKTLEGSSEPGYFARMVKATGDNTSKQLFNIAKSSWERSNGAQE